MARESNQDCRPAEHVSYARQYAGNAAIRSYSAECAAAEAAAESMCTG